MAGPARQVPAEGGGWARQPERSNLPTLRLMSWISLRLGRPAGRLVLLLITGYFLLFAPTARRASRGYLRRVLAREPRLGDIARHLHSFASTIHDRVYLLGDRFDLFDIEVRGEALLEPSLDAGNGALLFGAHLGSFELLRAVSRRDPRISVALTMYEDNAHKISQALDAINPQAMPQIIPLGHVDTMLRVRDALQGGTLVGLLADRTLGDEATTEVSLLGSPARLPSGPFRMAAMLRQPVFFMTGLYLGGNRYRVIFEPIADFSQLTPAERGAAIDQALHDYAAKLEDCCRQAPYNWFNFFDFWATGGRS